MVIVATCVNFLGTSASCNPTHPIDSEYRDLLEDIARTREPWDASVPHLNANDIVKGSRVLFVNHAALTWDVTASIRSQVNERIRQALENGDQVIYLVHGDSPGHLKKYYLKYRPSFLLISNNGSHKIRAQSKVIQISGGYWNSCAGETARDAILFAKHGKEPIRLELLTDSLYGWNDKPIGEYLKNLSDTELFQLIRDQYFSDDEVGKQNGFEGRHATTKNYTFKILRDGKKIGSIGIGKQLVEMNFLVDDIKNRDLQMGEAVSGSPNSVRDEMKVDSF